MDPGGDTATQQIKLLACRLCPCAGFTIHVHKPLMHAKIEGIGEPLPPETWPGPPCETCGGTTKQNEYVVLCDNFHFHQTEKGKQVLREANEVAAKLLDLQLRKMGYRK